MKTRLIAGLAAIAAAALGLGYYAGTAAPRGTPLVSAAVAAEGEAMFSDAHRSEIEGIIRNYLMANPEIIRDAIIELQRKESEAAQAAQGQVITDNAALLFNSPRQVVLGNPDGDVTLVEFFDYNCGYCRRAHSDMTRLIEEDPNLRVVLKEFPVLGEGSVQAAQVASAVLQVAPEKYGEFHEAMLTEPGQVDGPTALAVAEDVGIDIAKLEELAQGDETSAIISEAAMLGSNLQLTGTPSYVTKRQVIIGAVGYDALRQEIAEIRACDQNAAAC